METILAGSNGINAKLHKTDDVWFMYLDCPQQGLKEEQLLFQTKREAKAFFNKVNKLYQTN